ncbi:MAG: hypothetical protein WC813_04055 [Patescibacteria group bacterium]|jgi:vacuolar-type H+-ATPase subunit H
MFGKPVSTPPDRVFLLDWIEQDVLLSEAGERARKIVAELAKKLPEVQKLVDCSQTPPHHAEGPTVESHLVRILSVLFAIQSSTSRPLASISSATLMDRRVLASGTGPSSIEEFAREKTLSAEWTSLFSTIATNEKFLSAYVMAHDLGKPECVKTDELGRVHYLGHDRVGASPAFAYAREAILKYFELPSSSAKLLTELIRLHMDIITTFTASPSAAEFRAFAALAGRAGLNKDLFLDLAPVCLFLDAVAGSLHSDGRTKSHDLTPLLNWYRAEREAMPERHEAREAGEKKASKMAVKKAYADAHLSPEEIFELLGTPIGPIRGEIMKKIDELVKNPDTKVDFGEHTAEIRRRASNVKL